ncbi:fdrA domain protein [Clostridium sp. AF18-27]|uniref:fdrA domain protein n=1 Tax=Enterocloster lavalensis TaxID=460384 RepID=UPI000E4A4E84|nr:fdrA domain protein [Enterocloster lavalensis]MBS5603796.1 fdrA domain protein [Enterocloster asparagiformis]MCB6343046.1 fdrA domain protein [Enterocloster lavalensis]RHR51428.1 fdrA domain protein [Clostridium sp. AF18-27]
MAGLLEREVNVLNVGLKQFFTSLEDQDVKVLHVEWKPPVEDDEEIDDLLSLLL